MEPSGSLIQDEPESLSIDMSGLLSIETSLAKAPAGNSPVWARPRKMPVLGPVSSSSTVTESPLVASSLTNARSA